MVKNPFPTKNPIPPAFLCRFRASGNVIEPTNPNRAVPPPERWTGRRSLSPRAHRPVQQMNEKVSS